MTAGVGSGDTVWIDSAEVIVTAGEESHPVSITTNPHVIPNNHVANKPTAVLPQTQSRSGYATLQNKQLISSSSNIIVLTLFAQPTQQNIDICHPFCCVPLNVMVTTTANFNASRTKVSLTSNVIVRMHPLIYEYMAMQRQLLGATISTTNTENEVAVVGDAGTADTEEHPCDRCNDQHQESLVPVTIAPLPLTGYHVDIEDADASISNGSFWYLESTRHDSIVLPHGATITLQIMYQYDTWRQECCSDSSTTGRKATTDIGSNDRRAELDRIELQRSISLALYGRVITIGAILLLPVLSHDSSMNQQPNCRLYYYLVRIHDISFHSSISSHTKATLYRVDSENHDSLSYCQIEVIYPYVNFDKDDQATDVLHNKKTSYHVGVNEDCPGYEALQMELRQLLQLSMTAPTKADTARAAPSGILLTGCAGVGKTRFVTSTIGTQIGSTPSLSHYVSAHDLVMLASWAGEDMIIDAIYPPHRQCKVVVLDDLHIFGKSSGVSDNNSTGTTNGREYRLVLNSITQVIDRINNSSSDFLSSSNVSSPSHCAIIGIGRDKSYIPSELLKAGRLEKEVEMLPPSQSQREAILNHLLLGLRTHTGDDVQAAYESRCQEWAELIATATAGCVAFDLRRMCSDAWCNRLAHIEMETNAGPKIHNPPSKWPISWFDLSEAARNVIPSQLAMLDVTKPKHCLDCCGIDDWFRIHEFSWETFAGYDAVKKRVYRSVVVPWRRQFHHHCDSTEAGTIVPPSGILFHGPSGCGKTIAASCLGSSLGIPTIKVRAADVMDKWLGGSEATLRSLFTRARSAAPCILFFDEIDAIASNRANSDGVTSDVLSRLLSTLLNELDGISSTHHSNVVVVACTNRLESLDAALLRPGRLAEHILLTYPSQADSLAILKHNLARAPLDARLDLKQVAASLTNSSVSGADIAGICRDAIFRAIRRRSQDCSAVSITSDDIDNAVTAIKRYQ